MGLPAEGTHYFSYDTADNLLYEGMAVQKSAPITSAVWKVKRYVWCVGTGGDYVLTRMQWADGNELYDNLWSNASGLTYK